jgi:hypothetical protein
MEGRNSKSGERRETGEQNVLPSPFDLIIGL